MKCVNHPETEAEVLCASCNAPVCGDCRVALRDRDYCRPCLEEKIDTFIEPLPASKNKLLAFLLSLVPGAGYMYLGLMNRGLQTMLIFFGTIFVAGMTRIDHLVPLVLPVLLFYNVFDTLQLANQINQGIRVEDKPLLDLGERASWQNLLGYGLVALGLIALLNNLMPYMFLNRFLQQMVSPLIIIGIGVFILYRNLKGGRDNGGQGHV